MLTIVPKWKVTVAYAARENVVFWISDHHIENVMRQVASMQYTETGIERPTRVCIEEVR